MDLIDWGAAFLTLQVPKLRLDEAVESVHDHEGYAVHSLEVPFDDPSGIASLINPPELTAGFGCDIDIERSVVCVTGYFDHDDPSGAPQTELAHILSGYCRNIDLTARHLERFNSALPYILSVMAEDRLNELSEIAAGCKLGNTPSSTPEGRTGERPAMTR